MMGFAGLSVRKTSDLISGFTVGVHFLWSLNIPCDGTTVMQSDNLYPVAGLECPRGAEYMTCAPPCRATCRNPNPNPRCYTRRCRAGCYCPPPTVLHRGACIHPDKCRKRRKRYRHRNYRSVVGINEVSTVLI